MSHWKPRGESGRVTGLAIASVIKRRYSSRACGTMGPIERYDGISAWAGDFASLPFIPVGLRKTGAVERTLAAVLGRGWGSWESEVEVDGPTVIAVHPSLEVRQTVGELVRSMGVSFEEFEAPQEFVRNQRPDRPGCLVVGLRMPGLSGLELQQELHKNKNPLPIIFLTTNPDVASAVTAMKEGAIDFLGFPPRPHELWSSINRAVARDKLLRQEALRWHDLERRLATLSPGERLVFDKLVAGKAKRAIAAEMGLSTRTIEVRKAKIARKMRAATFQELVRIAVALESRPRQG